MQKDGQLNLLRDANLQLRSQVFDLNQDILDLLEIVESQKNRRMVSASSRQELRWFVVALAAGPTPTRKQKNFEINIMFFAMFLV